MTEYCDKCGGEIPEVDNEVALQKAIIKALLIKYGAHTLPRPTYCRCEEGLEPLELGGAK